MERQTLSKFIFVLIVGIGVIVFAILNIFNDSKTENDNLENMFKTEEERIIEQITDQVDERDEFASEQNAGSNTHSKYSETEGSSNNSNDQLVNQIEFGHDFEGEAIALFGRAVVDEASEIVEEIIRLWVLDDRNMDLWESLSSDSFFYYVQNERSFPPNSLNREVDWVETRVVQSSEKDTLLFEVEVSWFYQTESNVTTRQGRIFYVTVLVENNQLSVDYVTEL